MHTLTSVAKGTRRAVLVALVVGVPPLAAQQPLSLDSALREARAANAQLPAVALGARIARTQVREGEASLKPRLGLETGLGLGAPLAYTTPQAQVQLVASDTLFSGGLQQANLSAARSRVLAADAGLRMAEKDVDLAVRLRFTELLRADEEIAIRQQGIERLRSYLGQIQARRAAGQPVGGDILTTQVRLGTEEALLADAQRARDEARLQLNDLLGRDPIAPLDLEPLPPPTAPGILAGAPWMETPEVRQAAANRAASEAGIAATRAERRPQVAVSANVGALPILTPTNAGTGDLNTGNGLGGAVVFSLSMPVWDAGVFRARSERADVVATQARDSEVIAQRGSRLAWQMADAQSRRLFDQVQIWARNVPVARDAYLQTASMYAGGTATALEVLDAYAAWVDASEAYADAVLRQRQSEANAIRWGTP